MSATTERRGTNGVENGPSEVAPGVYRFGTDRVNWYVIEDEGRLTVVDAGLTGHWDRLVDGLASLGFGLDDVEALVLTHAHVDHLGFADRLRERGVPVWLHPADEALASEAGGPPPGRFLQNLWRPTMLRYFLGLVRAGVLSPEAVTGTRPLADGDTLPVPGIPRIIHTPGHTDGSCALFLPERDALLCGDALATFDFRGRRHGVPQLLDIVDADNAAASESLERFVDLGAVTLLPGHGEPWSGDAATAVGLARGD